MPRLKAPAQLPRSPSPGPGPASKSSVLEATRNLCTQVSNLGSGALNVPALQAAGLIGCQIIDIAQKIKHHQEACYDLVDRIGKLMGPIYVTLQGYRLSDIDIRLLNDINRLHESLMAVESILLHQLNRKRFSRALSSAKDAKKVAECKEMIDRQLVIFSTYSLISAQMARLTLNHTAVDQTTGNPSIAFNTTDISGNVMNVAGNMTHNYHIHNTMTNEAADASETIRDSQPSQPVPSERFFGRKKLLSILARLFINNEQCRIAILGSGGLGKTSLALHLIHHDIVVKRFNGRQFFVGCDGVDSADGLALRIMRMLNAPVAASGSVIDSLHATLEVTPPTLLLLDNFESIWDARNDVDAVRELLKMIASVKSVSLVVTMRATDPPVEIEWSYAETIPTLSPESAKETFQAIHGKTAEFSSSDSAVLDELLKELDYVPLAIHLLAQVSRGFKPNFILQRWRERRTQMLRLVTSAQTLNKLESIDVSISLSITSLDIGQNPGAIQLLGMLCMLPDGLLRWQERLEVIEEEFRTATDDLLLLRRFALVYVEGDTLRVFSPIRHFVLQTYPPDSQHAQCVYNIVWELVQTYASVDFGPEFTQANDILTAEIGNIGGIIDHAVAHDPEEPVIDIAVKISQHLAITHPSSHILKKVLGLVEAAEPIEKANYWWVSAETLRMQDENIDATKMLVKARDLFLEIGDRLGAAQCSKSLGDVLYVQGRYPEAAATLTETRSQFVEIGDRLGAAQCSRSLGDVLYAQGRYPEAAATLTEAQSQFVEIGHRLGAAQCSRSLGNVLYMQGRYPEAAVILTEARSQFVEIGDRLGAAQCSKSLGDVLYMQGRYPEAAATLTEARSQFVEIGSRLGAAHCSRSLGDVLYMQGRYPEASTTLTEARSQFVEIGSRLGAAQCSWSLGDVLYMQGQYPEAAATLTEARSQFVEIGDRLGAAQCSRSLGDVLYAQGRYPEAAATLTEARSQFVEIGNRLGATQCSQSLGDVLYMQGRYPEAAVTLTEARSQFVEIGGRRGAAQCSRSLGDVLRSQGEYSQATTALMDAKHQSLAIGDRLGDANCSRSLGQVMLAQGRHDEAQRFLTLARDGFIDIGRENDAADCSELLEECTSGSDHDSDVSDEDDAVDD